MDWTRRIATLVVVVAAVMVGCASGELEETNDDENDAGHNDIRTNNDIGPDGGDPCDECDGDDVCVDDQCVDLCADQQRQCGTVEHDGDDIDCGQCPLGDCNDGVCTGVCEELYATCGEVHYDGDAYDCGTCEGSQQCTRTARCIGNTGYIDVAAGRAHSCGLGADGRVFCWGRNEDGQLGDGQKPDASEYPVGVDELDRATTLSSLNNHGCASLDDQSVVCWGSNSGGRLGDGSTEEAPTPVVAEGVASTTVAAGGEHSCAITTEAELECWGDNAQGQLGGGEEASEPGERRQVVRNFGSDSELDGVVDVSLGSAHGCAVDDNNDLWCWGHNGDGQLGLGTNVDEPAHAHRVSDLEGVIGVAAGFHHSCAITVGGELWCWGRGDSGQIGDDEYSTQLEPQEVEFDQPVVDVAAGRFHTCAVVESGMAYCWGENEYGQLGIGYDGIEDQGEPEQIGEINEVLQIDAGGRHSCALDNEGQIHCWGRNDEGQLGDGSTTMRTSPTPIE